MALFYFSPIFPVPSFLCISAYSHYITSNFFVHVFTNHLNSLLEKSVAKTK